MSIHAHVSPENTHVSRETPVTILTPVLLPVKGCVVTAHAYVNKAVAPSCS